MKRTLHITLTPLDTFYFGNERNFGIGGNVNYFVRSRRFPQQTSLLGMLRYELLVQHSGKSQVSVMGTKLDSQASNYIGERSFFLERSSNHSLEHSTMKLGVIQQLSPIWIQRGDQYFWVAAKDRKLTLAIDEAATYASHLSETQEAAFNQQGVQLEGYDPKKGISEILISTAGDELEYEKVFKSNIREGIIKTSRLDARRKARMKDDPEQAFYRQERYNMVGGFSFGLYAYTDASFQGLDKYQNVVYLGGERSPFWLESRLISNSYVAPPVPIQLNDLAPGTQRILLCADTLVEPDIYRHCLFALTEGTVDFRFMRTSVNDTERYYNIPRQKHTSRKHEATLSRKYQLLPRGSVLYVRDDQVSDVQKRLKNDRLEQIGYNWYQQYSSSVVNLYPNN